MQGDELGNAGGPLAAFQFGGDAIGDTQAVGRHILGIGDSHTSAQSGA